MIDFLIQYGYIGVFLAAFLAATVLPFGSEPVVVGVLAAGTEYVPVLVAATIGNFLGGMSCYWLGWLGKTEWITKYLKMPEEKVDKWVQWLQDKGSWMAFFVFLPGVGDFFAVALGLLKARVWPVAFWMFLGKFLRYLVVFGAFDWIAGLLAAA